MSELIRFFRNIDPQFYTCIFGLVVTGIGIYNPLLLGLYSPDNNYNESPVMIFIFRLISGILFLIRFCIYYIGLLQGHGLVLNLEYLDFSIK